MREKNSFRVAALVSKHPVTELVMVLDPGFSTPRITMHICLSPQDQQRHITRVKERETSRIIAEVGLRIGRRMDAEEERERSKVQVTGGRERCRLTWLQSQPPRPSVARRR